jgi:hypothetical protein
MRFERFEIQNFRGIESAVVDLVPAGAGVFTLIGLNESGKTTILEAISKFDFSFAEPQSLYRANPTREDPASYVPKHLKSSFTGDISIRATIAFDKGEKLDLIRRVEESTKVRIDASSIPERILFTRGYRFVNSDLVERISIWNVSLSGRSKSERKDREFAADSAALDAFIEQLYAIIPQIVYFPTFLFDQPERIILNPGEKEPDVNRLYREIIENVAHSLPRPLDIKTHIVDRIVTPETTFEQIASFFSLSTNRQQQINAALDELSAHLSETVFDTWSKVFSGSFSGRQILLRLGIGGKSDGTPGYISGSF